MEIDPLKPISGHSPANRSLERGIAILRAFRPGSDLLGNGDIAERTGLSKSTVSRLTQTLVGAGMLQVDAANRAYRLAPAVLSFAHAMRTGSWVLGVAAPLMRAVAEEHRINVGLAFPDRDEMVYLESIRYNRRIAFRKVVSGQRVPMELTSLGRAYLSTTTLPLRQALFKIFEQRCGQQWPAIEEAIHLAFESVRAEDFCAAAWQPEVVALATPIVATEGTYTLNVSVSTQTATDAVVPTLRPHLAALKKSIVKAMLAASPS